VHKGSTQTNKRSKLGFKSKGAKEPECALVWRTGLFGVPPDSVRCTRTVQLRTFHLWVSPVPLRYNSSDCPVCHRTVRCTSGATTLRRNGRLHSAPDSATVHGRSQNRGQRCTGQLADIFTKPLDEKTFSKLRNELNIFYSRNFG
jgi:hypothetical protein